MSDDSGVIFVFAGCGFACACWRFVVCESDVAEAALLEVATEFCDEFWDDEFCEDALPEDWAKADPDTISSEIEAMRIATEKNPA